jgi:hypothetical protein
MPKRSCEVALLLLFVPLLLAACGGASHTAKKLTGPSPTSHAAGIKFANCIRAHGVSNFKTGREAVVPLTTYGIDTNSPAYIDAAKACNNA